VARVRPVSRPNRIAPILISVALGVVLPGCGGGDSKQVSAAELVQRADAACREERTSFERIQAHPPPNASVAAGQTGELLSATEKANSQLRDLEPPDQLRSAYQRYLDARDHVVNEMKRGQEAAENQDTRAYGAAQAAVARDASQRQKLAQSLGFKVCSTSPATA
jgi:hypothetical protein